MTRRDTRLAPHGFVRNVARSLTLVSPIVFVMACQAPLPAHKRQPFGTIELTIALDDPVLHVARPVRLTVSVTNIGNEAVVVPRPGTHRLNYELELVPGDGELDLPIPRFVTRIGLERGDPFERFVKLNPGQTESSEVLLVWDELPVGPNDEMEWLLNLMSIPTGPFRIVAWSYSDDDGGVWVNRSFRSFRRAYGADPWTGTVVSNEIPVRVEGL